MNITLLSVLLLAACGDKATTKDSSPASRPKSARRSLGTVPTSGGHRLPQAGHSPPPHRK